MQFEAVTPEDLTFTRAEWAEEGQQIEVAEVRGHQIVVEVTDEGKAYRWTVLATSETSETPEIIEDSTRFEHVNRGSRQAIRAALIYLNKHLRERAKAERKATAEEAKPEAAPTKPKRQRKVAAAA